VKTSGILAATACTCTLLSVATPALAAPSDHGHSRRPAGSHAKRDPAGNNGTIKIGTSPAGTGHGNVPHPGCAFTLRFFGFDDGQTADITFTGQAPTRLGTLLEQHGVAISDDAAGGGQDADAVLSYTAGQLGLTGQPQAKQGWHVKVAVDVLQAPGGAKQKVFWLKCPTPAQTPAQTPAAASRASGTSAATSATAATTTATAVAGTSASRGTRTNAARGAAQPSTAVLDSSAVAPTSTDTAAVGSGGVGRSGVGGGLALPFTGAETALAALAGAGLLVVGMGATVLGRRRRQLT
jgi:hypothetical protein